MKNDTSSKAGTLCNSCLYYTIHDGGEGECQKTGIVFLPHNEVVACPKRRKKKAVW